MSSVSTAPVHFSFESLAVPPETFEVTSFAGQEEISRPYRFEIDLVADSPHFDLEKLLYASATLSVERGDAARKIHGVAAECRLLESLPDHRFCYRVVLVPRIWLLSLSCQNQIYQERSAPDIVAEEIKGSNAKGATKDAKAGLTSDDFEMRLTRSYPVREYLVQYAESDLNFISRLMEHEGIFYFFEQGDDREKLIIGDNNIHFAALKEADTIAYRPSSGMGRAGDEAVLSLSCIARCIPRKLVLKDYNYRLPHVMLQAECDVEDKGHGVVCDYGDHFKSPEEGQALARIRAQELRWTGQTYEGTTNCVRLAPGLRFKLDEHFRQGFNSEYVVTRMTHKGRQPLEGAAGWQEGGTEAAVYENGLACIPARADYRPPRITPKPVVPGILNAHVDAALLENRAEIDTQGRYKLIMPFDLSGSAAGKATRFVRKAQPYGGQDMGMHFPLHKGTEVICNFVNGDPDRPIITGVVPNPLTASVVSSGNHTKNIIKTASGTFMEFNDGPGKVPSPPAGRAGQVGLQQQQQSLEAGVPPWTGNQDAGRPTLSSGKGDGQIQRPLNGLRQQQQFQPGNDTFGESDPKGSNDKWFRVKVPNYEGSNDSYLRLGASVSEEVLEQKDKSDDALVKDYDASPPQGTPLDPAQRDITMDCIVGNQIELNPSGVPPEPAGQPTFSLSFNTAHASVDAKGRVKFTAPTVKQDEQNYKVAEIETRYEFVTIVTNVYLNIRLSGDLYPAGWFDYTAGRRTSVTIGNKEDIVQGTYVASVRSENDWISYKHILDNPPHELSVKYQSESGLAFGDSEMVNIGSKMELGLANEFNAKAGLDLSAFGGIKYEYNIGPDIKYKKEEELAVSENITLAVEPKAKWTQRLKESAVFGSLLASIAVNTGLNFGSGAIAKGLDESGDVSRWVLPAVQGTVAGGILSAWLLASYAKDRIEKKKGRAQATRINMDTTKIEIEADRSHGGEKIELKCGQSSIVIGESKIVFKCGGSELTLGTSEIQAQSKNLISLKLGSGKRIDLNNMQLGLKHDGKISSNGKMHDWL